MLIGKLLNSDATINNYYEIGSLQFVSGEAFTVVMQVFGAQSGLRKMLIAQDNNPSHIAVTLTLPNLDGSDLSLTMTQMTNDASIWSAAVNSTQSALLAMGNAQFSVVDSSMGAPGPVMGFIPSALSLVITGDVP
jgi:hypothetical protein